MSKLTTTFPSALRPIIISAPMLGVANGTLAAHVSLAGGIGFIPYGFDFTPSSPFLPTLKTELTKAREILQVPAPAPLPVGVGLILTHPSLFHFFDTLLPVLVEHNPVAVWLFAPDPEGEAGLIRRMVDALHKQGMLVFFQVGTVEKARQAVLDGADVVVAQGVDAGGHQFARGAGVVSLVPEVVEMVGREFAGTDVVVAAAGGIADGRGVAGVLGLGAEAAVLGTRFIVADEASTPEFRKKLILEAQDGGQATAKSSFHDEIQSSKLWGQFYDGRALVDISYREHLEGLSMEENLDKFRQAKLAGEVSRQVTWAGTGVGLVKNAGPAREIVQQVREEAKESIRRLQKFL
ncbi:hypothetical protein OQA88_9761 [Cercophora sp. LCS_1]